MAQLFSIGSHEDYFPARQLDAATLDEARTARLIADTRTTYQIIGASAAAQSELAQAQSEAEELAAWFRTHKASRGLAR